MAYDEIVVEGGRVISITHFRTGKGTEFTQNHTFFRVGDKIRVIIHDGEKETRLDKLMTLSELLRWKFFKNEHIAFADEDITEEKLKELFPLWKK